MEKFRPEKYKIIFMGTPEFATDALRSLINENYNIAAVFTQPDKPAGRRQILTSSPIKKLALKYNLPLYQPASLKDEEIATKISKLKPDLIIITAFGQIIPKTILNIPKFGCINIHASLLPRWRGASPIAQAILAGDKYTGDTIMLLDRKLDHGPILSQKKIKIENDDNLESLSKKLSESGAELLIKTLPDFLENKIALQMQDDSKATYAPLVKKNDGRIDWHNNAEEIERQIRAFTPWPSCWTTLNNKRLKIIKAAVFDKNKKNSAPGLIAILDNKLVADCKNGKLALEIIQLEGKKQTSSEEFIKGYSNIILNNKLI